MLYYFTACKPDAKNHINKTIVNKYDLSKHEDIIENNDIENLKKLGIYNGATMWGATPGEGNIPRWSKMKIGDKILVYYDNRFRYYGEIIYKLHNEELAEKIWGRDNKNRTWEYSYFIGNLKEVDIDKEVFNKFFAYSNKFNPQGYSNINLKLMDFLENEYGSIDNVIRFLNAGELEKFDEVFNTELESLGEKNIEDSISEMSEEDFLKYINGLNSEASIELVNGLKKVRKYNKKLINDLKDRKKHKCQICGQTSITEYGVSIVEAHHIEKFSITQNNKPENIIILCPNHHRLVHKCKANIDIKAKKVTYSNGLEESIIL